MDISAIITVVVWISAMILICGAFAGLRRNNCCISWRLRVSRQAATSEGGVTVGNIPYNSPPFVYLYNVSSTRLDTVAPEIVYDSKESILKQKPQLKALVSKRYFEKQLPKQDEEEESFANRIQNTVGNWDELARSSANTEKSVLEEELSDRSVHDQHKYSLEPSLSDVVVDESEDTALLAFGELLKSQTMCVICLEDFEKGCFVRVLSCTHMFHSVCLRQWLTKSVYCPLCKKHVFKDSEYGQEGGRYRYRSLFDGPNLFNTSNFLTRNSPDWFDIERREYQTRGQSWQNRNVLTAFI
ncbi:hypothetical protein GpartN1_g1506.t1 [Galdieria partita]|uniref:RING-type E3 ubiquitin transferase n=1 Tax=Galdieria partita TaxID=83374 RepID=A0A9C7UNQ4_9RHOD|nr:hypothetical protein GpartN1_g459.t1 [Galdieria partita]GJQ09715.1 hypothetical protein GpartN1_g1506.t1 [Galdieria partita]